ncbi:MAG: gephyrin-like molybdotransferase Glp [Rhodospirillales bacterium]
MAQLSDDCFAFGGPLLSVDEAVAMLETRLVPVAGVERVPLTAAVDRILADDLVAALDVPPFDNSAVDGYAVRHADLRADGDTSLPVAGRVAAGHALGRDGRAGEAVRIFTGAPMPAGLDTVMMQEDAVLDGGHVVLRPGLKAGANRRRAGEDLARGTLALAAGRRLRPQDVGLCAALGLADVAVRTPLRVAVFSTGDEVAEPGRPVPPAAVYDSNRLTLRAMLARLGCAVSDMGILPDDPARLGAALAGAAAGHDLLLTSGGVSTGEEDHVKTAVEGEGSLHFWRLAIKPGRPVAMGQVRGTPFVGLPGNPVAVVVTFVRLVRPLLLRLAGAAPERPLLYPVVAGFDYRKKAGRREYVRVRLVPGADGVTAEKFGRDGAGVLSSLVGSDGFVELPETVERLAIGDRVWVLPFDAVL